jgi:hypothetical protein
MNWADANGIGYLAWAWWDASDLSGDAAVYALYTGPNFTPKAPEGTAFKAHLASLGPLTVADRAFSGGPLPVAVSGVGSASAPIRAGSVLGPIGESISLRENRYLRVVGR